jgi:hypothetical protein
VNKFVVSNPVERLVLRDSTCIIIGCIIVGVACFSRNVGVVDIKNFAELVLDARNYSFRFYVVVSLGV